MMDAKRVLRPTAVMNSHLIVKIFFEMGAKALPNLFIKKKRIA
jgi:hypothetical protein